MSIEEAFFLVITFGALIGLLIYWWHHDRYDPWRYTRRHIALNQSERLLLISLFLAVAVVGGWLTWVLLLNGISDPSARWEWKHGFIPPS